ncbi:MAG: Maf family protein, partial [Negativicutes bacterium]|nr:Maf family protein [Negativicutes bacterium]
MNDKKLILASSSPRRLALLEQAGYTVDVVSPDLSIEEEKLDILDPVEYVKTLSMKKMLSVASLRKDEEMVVGADTIVFLKGRIFEKPKSADQAIEFLRELSGQTHQV